MPSKFFYKKSYLGRSALIPAVFSALALYVVYSNPDYAPWMSAIFLIIAAYYIFKAIRFILELTTPRPVVEFSPEGIIDRRSIGTNPLPYAAIATIVLVRRNSSLIIITKESADLSGYGTPVSRFSNMIRNKTGRSGGVFMLTPALALDAEFEQVLVSLKSATAGTGIRFEEQGAT